MTNLKRIENWLKSLTRDERGHFDGTIERVLGIILLVLLVIWVAHLAGVHS